MEHVVRTERGASGANLLLVGQREITTSVVERLRPSLREPVAAWRPGERLVLSSDGCDGTIILHDVDALEPDDQRRLLDWLEGAPMPARVVSTTSASLLERVAGGAFLDPLFRRLNIVRVEVSNPSVPFRVERDRRSTYPGIPPRHERRRMATG